jgi:hypothetical protein
MGYSKAAGIPRHRARSTIPVKIGVIKSHAFGRMFSQQWKNARRMIEARE